MKFTFGFWQDTLLGIIMVILCIAGSFYGFYRLTEYLMRLI